MRRPERASSDSGTELPTGSQIGLGVRSSGMTRVLTQGSLTETDNQLDVAVDGRGYFGIQLPNGNVAYTRDGSFRASSTGQIVTTDGYVVEPSITVPPTSVNVTINQQGQVISTDGNGKQTTVGQLHLYIVCQRSGAAGAGRQQFP